MLQAGLAGSISAIVGASGCASNMRREPDKNNSLSEFQTGAEPFELHEMTIDDLQDAMTSGEFTARSVTERYLNRIKALNRQGPELRAVIETNPDALQIANRLDDERRSGVTRGPLHGIPVVLKDNIDTHDRMSTTAGSLALEGSIPPRDSFVAERLREAGAILLAKANMSEWAYWRGINATSGWSARGGQCRNPYVLDRNPCGSSSGSAAAVAANLSAIAVGTETGGSIVCPAAINGIVGIKPTVGLWSRSGIIPISHSQDSAGPMTRTVRDGAILLGALTGVDPRDRATAASVERSHTDYTQFLDADGLNGARIGVARNFSQFDARVVSLFDDAVESMKARGATCVDPANVPNADNAEVFGNLSRLALGYEFKAGINAYFENLGPNAPIKNLTELIAFNNANDDVELRYFGQELLIEAEAAGPLTDPAYIDAITTIQRQTRTEGIDAIMDQHNLDAVVAPTAGMAWITDPILGDRFDGGFSGEPAAIAGYPDITVPMGFVAELPVGISFFGRAWSEPTLLRIAYAFEQTTRRRQSPKFLKSLN